MSRYVLDFAEADRTRIALVGGKGAHLGELSRIEGVRVPPGFCVTTDAFRRVRAETPSLGALLERLARLRPGDRAGIAALAAEIRATIEAAPVPGDVAAEVGRALARLGGDAAVAVRSSATAEDRPSASAAGQHDSFLSVAGPAAVLRHVARCWGSLFSERAVTYGLRRGLDPREAAMAVVVQRMVLPRASGVLFTADPVTGHRRVSVVESVPGLGEALVSGRAAADVHRVRDGEVVERTVAAKRLAVIAAPEGGTREEALDPERGARPALTDAEAVRLAALGRRVEARFGHPQDVEWCLADEGFAIVQSRPITTLFPVPAADDGGNHVYLSVGHQQMMTEAMRPLGLSLWQLTTPRPMAEAGGRLFVDVTRTLASPEGRASLLALAERSDPLMADAMRHLVDRGDFLPPPPQEGAGWTAPSAGETPLDADPALVEALVARGRDSVAALEREIGTKRGPALFDFILEDLRELRRLLFDPESLRVVMSGMEAAWWLNERLEAWLGERNAADALSRSVPDNPTSEMGLALLDVADAVRPHPEVVEFLEGVADDGFLDRMDDLAGGPEARDAIRGFLERYGMRCVGEIDVTRPRWGDRPSALLPMILGNVRNFEPGAAARRFERGLREAREKEREVLERLRALPDGAEKAEEVRRRIERVRAFAGYREYPKYGMVSRYAVYRRALVEEARRLVRAGVLGEEEDAFFLTFAELHEAARTGRADLALVRERREAFRGYRELRPPRVLTSDGEMLSGSYRRGEVPAGALPGLPVSAGTAEGRARVVRDVAGAELAPGDILVTPSTDPSWTPLFVAVDALVTEVGGLTTHGSVIAREYGLPAVVGVEDATRRIRDGQRIRVNGTDGYVEILDAAADPDSPGEAGDPAGR